MPQVTFNLLAFPFTVHNAADETLGRNWGTPGLRGASTPLGWVPHSHNYGHLAWAQLNNLALCQGAQLDTSTLGYYNDSLYTSINLLACWLDRNFLSTCWPTGWRVVFPMPALIDECLHKVLIIVWVRYICRLHNLEHHLDFLTEFPGCLCVILPISLLIIHNSAWTVTAFWKTCHTKLLNVKMKNQALNFFRKVLFGMGCCYIDHNLQVILITSYKQDHRV